MKRKEVIIGLTYGDPAGIGPEILFKTIRSWNYKPCPLIIGSNIILNKYIKYLKNNKKILSLIKYEDLSVEKITLGKPSKNSGLHSYKCLRKSVNLALNKKINGLFTGPVSKAAISSCGFNFSGQTDEIAKLCGLKNTDVIMLFVCKDLRISLFTRHIPLKDVPKMLTKFRLKEHIFLLHSELKKWFHIKNPAIAVLGLNPHSSEEGLFGSEEDTVIIPAIKELKSSGLNIHGPLSPDSTLASAGRLFLSKKKQKYDVYVSFYHDQALPMFKAVSGLEGVNVTLGLPFIRVSVDHGTAFDIAGKNIADNRSMLSALNLMNDILKG